MSFVYRLVLLICADFSPVIPGCLFYGNIGIQCLNFVGKRITRVIIYSFFVLVSIIVF